MFKIAHFDTPIWQQEILKNSLGEYDNTFYTNAEITEENIKKISDIDMLTVFVHTSVTKEILQKFKNLKLIITRSTGFDHIDSEYCKEKGITVASVPGYGSETVAEYTFGFIMNIARKYTELNIRSKAGNYEFSDLMGFDLSGKTIGVIGAGKIGRNTLQIASGFDMNLIAHDIYEDKDASAKIGYKYVDIDTLLSTSDIISLHTPLNDYTANLLSHSNLLKVKKGAVLINTARGDLIQNVDLLWALENGVFSAVALDTIQDEKLVLANTPNDIQKQILQNPAVIFTPHSAFYTKEAVTRILNTTVENIKSFALPNNHTSQ